MDVAVKGLAETVVGRVRWEGGVLVGWMGGVTTRLCCRRHHITPIGSLGSDREGIRLQILPSRNDFVLLAVERGSVVKGE
jgi:hypothetical protein